MLTLAFGMMIYSIAWKWRDFTGGDDGLVGIPRAPLEIPGLVTISMTALDRYYYIVLLLSLLAMYAMYRLLRSPLGLTLQAIRESDTRAAFGEQLRRGHAAPGGAHHQHVFPAHGKSLGRHRSFKVVRLNKAKMIATIRKRVITFGSSQPLSSK